MLPFFQSMLRFARGPGWSVAARAALTRAAPLGACHIATTAATLSAPRERVGSRVPLPISRGTFYLQIKEQKPGKTVNYSLSFASRVNEF